MDGASIRCCRSCPLRKPRQWNGAATAKPRQGNRLLHPLRVSSAPLLWRDWSHRVHRRASIQFVRHQRIEVSLSPPAAASPPTAGVILTRSRACSHAPRVDGAPGSQCAPRPWWPGDDLPLWRPRRLRHLVREGSGLKWASVPLEPLSLLCENEADKRSIAMSASMRRSAGWNTQNQEPC